MTKTARRIAAGGVAVVAALGIGLFTHNAPTQAASPSTAPVPATTTVVGTVSWLSPWGTSAPGLTYEGNAIQGVLDVRPNLPIPSLLGPDPLSAPELVLITAATHMRWAPRPAVLPAGRGPTVVATVTGSSIAGHMMVAASVYLTEHPSPPIPWKPAPLRHDHS